MMASPSVTKHLFRVKKSKPGSGVAQERYFVHKGEPIGNPSAYARVYKGYESNEYEDEINTGWIIKQAVAKEYEVTFKGESGILQSLADRTRQLAAGQVYSPDPVYLVEDVDSGLPGLVMPFYRRTLSVELNERYAYPQPRTDFERFVVERLLEYMTLLEALHEIKYLCTDRKEDDLFWHEEHLIVIDWNLLRPRETKFESAEMSLTGRIWYSLITGYQPPPDLDPYNDALWQRSGQHEDPLGPVSVGLRILLGRALRGQMSVEKLQQALNTWQKILDQPRSEIIQWARSLVGVTRQVDDDILRSCLSTLSGRQFCLVLYDLASRMEYETYAPAYGERQSILEEMRQNPDILGGIGEELQRIKNGLIARGDYETAAAQLQELLKDSTSEQRVAIQRWQYLLEDLLRLTKKWDEFSVDRLKERNRLSEGIEILQYEWRRDTEAGLSAVIKNYEQSVKYLGANNWIGYLLDEAQMRLEVLKAIHRVDRPEQERLAYLESALDFFRRLPPDYAKVVLQGFDIEKALQETASAADAKGRLEEAKRQVEQVYHEVVESGDWSAADFTVYRAIQSAQNDLLDDGLEGELKNATSGWLKAAYCLANLRGSKPLELRDALQIPEFKTVCKESQAVAQALRQRIHDIIEDAEVKAERGDGEETHSSIRMLYQLEDEILSPYVGQPTRDLAQTLQRQKQFWQTHFVGDKLVSNTEPAEIFRLALESQVDLRDPRLKDVVREALITIQEHKQLSQEVKKLIDWQNYLFRVTLGESSDPDSTLSSRLESKAESDTLVHKLAALEEVQKLQAPKKQLYTLVAILVILVLVAGALGIYAAFGKNGSTKKVLVVVTATPGEQAGVPSQPDQTSTVPGQGAAPTPETQVPTTTQLPINIVWNTPSIALQLPTDGVREQELSFTVTNLPEGLIPAVQITRGDGQIKDAHRDGDTVSALYRAGTTAGPVEITASFAGNDTVQPASVTAQLTLVDEPLQVQVFTLDNQPLSGTLIWMRPGASYNMNVKLIRSDSQPVQGTYAVQIGLVQMSLGDVLSALGNQPQSGNTVTLPVSSEAVTFVYSASPSQALSAQMIKVNLVDKSGVPGASVTLQSRAPLDGLKLVPVTNGQEEDWTSRGILVQAPADLAQAGFEPGNIQERQVRVDLALPAGASSANYPLMFRYEILLPQPASTNVPVLAVNGSSQPVGVDWQLTTDAAGSLSLTLKALSGGGLVKLTVSDGFLPAGQGQSATLIFPVAYTLSKIVNANIPTLTQETWQSQYTMQIADNPGTYLGFGYSFNGGNRYLSTYRIFLLTPVASGAPINVLAPVVVRDIYRQQEQNEWVLSVGDSPNQAKFQGANNAVTYIPAGTGFPDYRYTDDTHPYLLFTLPGDVKQVKGVVFPSADPLKSVAFDSGSLEGQFYLGYIAGIIPAQALTDFAVGGGA